MMATTPPNRLTFRPARLEDKPRVIEITANTWGDGGDYIPQVWERWLADSQGELTVAEVDGAVVALAKLTWVGDGQWWMEGLRVHPDWRLRGIGQAMNTYQVALAKKLGGRVVRYATGIRNDGSHRIAERAGFHVLTRFVERVADKLDEPVAGLETLDSANLDALWTMAQDSDLLRSTNHVCVYAWRAFELTREWLAEHLKAGEIIGVRDVTGRVAAWCMTEIDPEWDRLGVMPIDGTSEGMATLARSLRAHAAVLGKVMVEAMTPVVPRALDALSSAGYHIEVDPLQPDEMREHGVDILELRLDK
jgi:N-acetylglutamate synthase-like GNAT family acetyltransferase